jgi:hypothetical protein
MKHRTIDRTGTIALAVAFLLATCDALDLPSRIQIDSDPDSADLSKHKASLRQVLAVDSPELFGNSCPVCDTYKLAELDRFVQSTLSKYKRHIRNSSSFTRFQRSLRRPLVLRLYNKPVSAETIAPILRDTASHFAALADVARVLQKSALDAAPTDSAVVTDTCALLEKVATTSALLVTEVSSALTSKDSVTAGIVATGVLSVLGFFERFTLSATSTIAGCAVALAGNSVQSVEGKLDTYSAVTLDAAFSDVLTFLSARGDSSGLISALGRQNDGMLQVNDLLLELRSKAYPVASGETTIEVEGIAEVVSLIDGIAFTVLSSVIRLAVVIPPVIGGIATNTFGLFQQRVQTIVTLVNSTSSSSHVMFDEAAKGSSVSGDTLLLRWCFKKHPREESDDFTLELDVPPCAIPFLILTSPIWLPALLLFLIIYRLQNNSRASWSQVQCRIDALSCQNDALAASLPSL